MATITFAKCRCQVCNSGIEFEAARAGETVECPHCKMETVLFVPPPGERAPEPKIPAIKESAKPNGGPKLILKLVIVVAVLLFILAAIAMSVSRKTAPSDQPAAVRNQAIEMALDIVSNSLKAPLTAKFSAVSCEVRKNGLVFVTGKVDSQNAFGAMLRNSWMCILTNENSERLVYIMHNVGDEYQENPQFKPKH